MLSSPSCIHRRLSGHAWCVPWLGGRRGRFAAIPVLLASLIIIIVVIRAEVGVITIVIIGIRVIV
jgi:hypothetical protein